MRTDQRSNTALQTTQTAARALGNRGQTHPIHRRENVLSLTHLKISPQTPTRTNKQFPGRSRMAHLQPLAVAQTSSSPAGCTAMSRGASPAPPSPSTALACSAKPDSEVKLKNSTNSEPGKPRRRWSRMGRFRTRGEGEREHSLASKPSTSSADGEPAAPTRPYAANTRAAAAFSTRRRIHAAHATFPRPAAEASPPPAAMGGGCGGCLELRLGLENFPRDLQGEPASSRRAESSAVVWGEGREEGIRRRGEPKTTTSLGIARGPTGYSFVYSLTSFRSRQLMGFSVFLSLSLYLISMQKGRGGPMIWDNSVRSGIAVATN